VCRLAVKDENFKEIEHAEASGRQGGVLGGLRFR
jgi:hypothetical protein